MPFCRRDSDDAAFEIMLDESRAPAPEWREPPGRLGEYVRRVKRQSATLPQRARNGAAS